MTKSKKGNLGNDIDARVLELYALYNISKVLNLSFAVEEIFNGTIDIIGQTLQIDEFCIMLFDEKSRELVVRAWYPDPGILPDVRFQLGEGISGITAKTGRQTLIQDTRNEPHFLFYKGTRPDIGAFLCVPLAGKQGDILGVFNVHKTKANSFSEGDVRFFTEVAEQVAVAVEKAMLFDKTREASMRDDLTRLYNRRYFFEYLDKELARARRYDKHFSLFMIDIDHFKQYNDENGHLKGDNLLKSLAELLVSKLRSSDVVARYGGEEFICLLPEASKDFALFAAEKLRKAVEEERFACEKSLPSGKVTVTIGVATWPEDAKTSLELIEYADKALYLGKRQGKNRICAMVEEGS